MVRLARPPYVGIMKSARIHEYGDPSVIRYEDAPRPAPGPGEVLIRVAATSFNPTETFLRSGALHDAFPLTFPTLSAGTSPAPSPKWVLGWTASPRASASSAVWTAAGRPQSTSPSPLPC